MKKTLFSLLACLLISTLIFAQSSNGFKYQAIIRDAAGNINANASVQIGISILQGSTDGIEVFTETHQVTSNAFGLVNLTIGSQNPNDFELIDWANDPYFIKITVDGVEFGTSQLLSVPYALHAKTAAKASIAETVENIQETDPLFVASPIANITQSQIEEWSNKLSEYAETDPIFIASVVAGISQSDIENWNQKLDEYLESDPTFANHPSYNITNGMLKNWDSAYQWGNHQNEGYLKSFTETDPVFAAHPAFAITAEDIVKWKALFIWYTTNANGYLKADSPAGGITAADTAKWNKMAGGTFTLSDVIAVNDSANGQIKNLSEPTDPKDAATKAYVDMIVTKLDAQGLLGATDIEGNNYSSVKIGSQIWMTENLKTTKYNDGSDIPLASPDSATWVDMTSPAYCWYNNDSATYAQTYGALYNWYAVDTSILCPTGWRVPDTTDWNTLKNFVGGVSVAGSVLREIGTSHWDAPNLNATNMVGFTALPNGGRFDHEYGYLGETATWWTATEFIATEAFIFITDYSMESLFHGPDPKYRGFGVRCIKD